MTGQELKLNRVIKKGKLDVVVELVGGSADGTLCSCDLDIIRIPRRRPVTSLFSDHPITAMPDYDVDEYRRISLEKAVLIT